MDTKQIKSCWQAIKVTPSLFCKPFCGVLVLPMLDHELMFQSKPTLYGDSMKLRGKKQSTQREEWVPHDSPISNMMDQFPQQIDCNVLSERLVIAMQSSKVGLGYKEVITVEE